MAKQFIEGGLADCVMALGFEKMEKGSLGAKYTDRINPMDKHVQLMADLPDFTVASGSADVRQRRARTYGALRHDRLAVRKNRMEEP